MTKMNKKETKILAEFLEKVSKSPLGSLLSGDSDSIYTQIINNFIQIFANPITLFDIRKNLNNNKYTELEEILVDLGKISANCISICQNIEQMTNDVDEQRQLIHFNAICWYIERIKKKIKKKVVAKFDETIPDLINDFNCVFDDEPIRMRAIVFNRPVYGRLKIPFTGHFRKKNPFMMFKPTNISGKEEYRCPYVVSKKFRQEMRVVMNSEKIVKDNIEKNIGILIENKSADEPVQSWKPIQRIGSKVPSQFPSRKNSSAIIDLPPTQNDVIYDESKSVINVEEEKIQKKPKDEEKKLNSVTHTENEAQKDEIRRANTKRITDESDSENDPSLFHIVPQIVRPKSNGTQEYEVIPVKNKEIEPKIQHKPEPEPDPEPENETKVYVPIQSRIQICKGKKYIRLFGEFGIGVPTGPNIDKSEKRHSESNQQSEKDLEETLQKHTEEKVVDLGMEETLELDSRHAAPININQDKTKRKYIYDKIEEITEEEQSSNSDEWDDDIKNPVKIKKLNQRKTKVKKIEAEKEVKPGRPRGRKKKQDTLSDEDIDLFCNNIARMEEFIPEKKREKAIGKLMKVIINNQPELYQQGGSPIIDIYKLENKTISALISVVKIIYGKYDQDY